MFTAYKFRIYPDEKQKELFVKTFGCVRSIYNKMLADKIEHYKKTQKMLNNTPAQYKKNFPYFKEVDSLALANAQINLQTAYKNFFNNPKTGFPNFKSKKNTRRSYTTNLVKNNIELKSGKLKLPKVGFVKIKQHREIPEGYILKAVTISQNGSGKFFASILFKYEHEVIHKEPKSFLGMDYSMHDLYVDSEGNKGEYERFYRKSEQKLKREQRKLSLMKKGSKNRAKQRIKVAKVHEKIANSRKDFLQKKSRQIANVYDCVCIENLDMKGMSQSLNFGKSVHDNAFGRFTELLSYKLEEQGKYLVKVDRFYPSSQLCSVCGYKNKETKDLSIREWICPQCGTSHDRDINAAVNLRNEGKRLLLNQINKNRGALGVSLL
ncbi:putative transposase [Succinivibrio dextrinosolvens]|uniref:RNA-guided endonuclease TnpB family protein n=1 Tax=Succinivibrio dextrinosolvens TaxID=83771 RepID=UPI0008E846AF|nr:RNA-guided endonuclease TnpB family protein [Succinivibrio dextrinosolvens]SFS32743.1 putative transposase [Succinivibrio dextrinosolvens]